MQAQRQLLCLPICQTASGLGSGRVADIRACNAREQYLPPSASRSSGRLVLPPEAAGQGQAVLASGTQASTSQPAICAIVQARVCHCASLQASVGLLCRHTEFAVRQNAPGCWRTELQVC